MEIKNLSSTKRSGDKSHLFSRYVKRFDNETVEINQIWKLISENISNKKYLNTVQDITPISSITKSYISLENFIDYTLYNDKSDLFFNVKGSIFETLKEN